MPCPYALYTRGVLPDTFVVAPPNPGPNYRPVLGRDTRADGHGPRAAWRAADLLVDSRRRFTIGPSC